MRHFNRGLFARVLCASIVGLIALAPLAARAGTIVSDAGDWDYMHKQLANSNKYRPVGMFTMVSSSGQLYLASGTVIGDPINNYGVGSQWVLTAAHVVNGMKELDFDVDGYRYIGDRWYVPKTWDGQFLSGTDIALVHLAMPTIVHPAKLYSGSNPIKDEITIVGYGSTGTGDTGNALDAGTKRAGDNILDGYADSHGLEGEYDFDAPESEQLTDLNQSGGVFPIGMEYSAAEGDSGGPIYDGDEIVGVTSWGTVGSFFGGTNAFTLVKPKIPWITAVLAGDLTDADEGTPLDPLPDLTNGGSTASGMPGTIDGQPLDYSNFVAVAKLNYDSLADVPIHQPTPEPATLSLLAVGGLTLLKRRRTA